MKELTISVSYSDPRKIGFPEIVSTDGNVYFINYLNSTQTKLKLDYKIDGKKQRNFDIKTSFTPDDIGLYGMLGKNINQPRSYECSATIKNVEDCPSFEFHFNPQHLGTYIVSFDVDGIIKIMSLNVLPDPTSCTLNSNLEECLKI